MRYVLLKAFQSTGAVFALGVGIGACAGLPHIGPTSWKEEALLHDGSRIVVSRSVSRGGRRDVGERGERRGERCQAWLIA